MITVYGVEGKASYNEMEKKVETLKQVGDVQFPQRCDVLTMRCFPILSDAIFSRWFWKNIDLDVLDDVWKNPKHRAHDAY